MYIILVRHGETDYNKLGIIQGSEVDPPLNEFGKKQASITGDFINKNFNIDVIYSSKYLRAKQTAALIKRKINYTGKVYLNNDLREASKGILYSNFLKNCNIGIANKDGSIINLSDNNFENNNQNILSYVKKKSFQKPTLNYVK